MSKMAEEYKNSEVTWVAWQKGGHCAALSQNGKWYRARITNMIHKNVIEVRLPNLTHCILGNFANSLENMSS